ncbi:MAG: hypothetical protein R3A44_17100 [Caldilineaceae bacterium]
MNRLFVNFGGGLLLLILLAIFGVMAWNQGADIPTAFQSPLPTAAPLPVAPCLTATDAGFTFAVAGYVTHGNGATTLTFTVTNANKKDISYMAFGTADWTRLAPSDGMTTTMGLGEYQVEWTKDKGNPDFASIKYETHFGGYSQGATETFTMTVSGFDPSQPVALEAKAGKDKSRVTITLADPACDQTPPPPPPFSPLPTPTPTPEGDVVLPTEPQVAECIFEPPAGGLPPEEPIIPLSAYSFSEPQVVLTNTAFIGIEQWLPDNETLLVTRSTGRGSAAELINTRTGQISRLIGPDQSFKNPRWLPQDSTLVWGAAGTTNREPGYWVHSFNPSGERRLTDDWGSKHDISPNGKEFIFLSPPGGTQPFIWNQETKTLRALQVDLNNWRHQNGPLYLFQSFNVNWQPIGDKILFWDGTWVFLYNLTTNSGCELNMQDFAGDFDSIVRAAWSPNGRYLWAQLTLDPPYISTRGPYDLLWLLDTYTGKNVQYSVDIAVASFTWATDNQTIVFSGPTGKKSGDFDQHGIYLLNIHNGEVRRIPTVENLSISNPQWSADGTLLAFHCHDYSGGFNFDDYRVCTSQVSLGQ